MAGPVICEPFAYITNLESNDVSVIDIETHTVIATVGVEEGPQGLAVNSDASRVYVANSDSDSVTVLDGNSQMAVVTIPVGRGPLGVAVSPDDQRVFVVCREALWVIDAKSLSVEGTVPLTGTAALGVAVSRDGRNAYVTSSSEGTVHVVDVQTLKVIEVLRLGGGVGIAVGPDGRIWIANRTHEIVQVLEGTSHEILASIPLPGHLTGLTVSSTGSRVYVTSWGPSAVFALDASSYEVLGQVAGGSVPVGIALSPDGNEIYVADYLSNEVAVIDGGTLRVETTIPVGDLPVAFGRFIRPGIGPAITEIPTSGTLGLQILALILLGVGLIRIR